MMKIVTTKRILSKGLTLIPTELIPTELIPTELIPVKLIPIKLIQVDTRCSRVKWLHRQLKWSARKSPVIILHDENY